MINLLFHDTPSELISVADSARKFASSNFSTHEKEFDINDFKKMAAQGFAGASIAENYGGSNLSNFAIANLIFELAKVQLGPAIYLSVHLMSAKLINNFSTNKNDLLSALASGEKFAAFCLTEANSGSDAAALQTKAEKRNDKFILNGEKIYITSAGHADVYLVFARTSADKTKGISAFIVEKNSPGLSFGKEEKKMGCLGSPIASVKFDNCEIPEANLLGSPGDGFKIALSGLDGGRVNIAAAACGLSASALEICSEYAKNRKQFSQSIADFQGIQFLISDMLMHLKSSLLLVREAATELDLKINASSSASMAKCFSTDAAMKITTDAVQILGGAGYIKDYIVERLMRDAKMLQIVEGTNQIQRAIIAKNWLTKNLF